MLRISLKSPWHCQGSQTLCAFHSSAPARKSRKGSSKIKVSASLKFAALQATRLKTFEAERALPHSDVPESQEIKEPKKTPSFRRHSYEVRQRRGTWADEMAQIPRRRSTDDALATLARGKTWVASADAQKSSRKGFSRSVAVDSPTSKSNSESGRQSTAYSKHPESQDSSVMETNNLSSKKILPSLKEFYHPPPSLSHRHTPTKTGKIKTLLGATFSSPPLMEGLRNCLINLLGPQATPTEIQIHSINHILSRPSPSDGRPELWKQYLLASETGSGKSIAYLLPLLQSLKQSEIDRKSSEFVQPTPSAPQREYNPRAIILAPTHELSRQLSGFAKALSHEIKLRVVCASQANMRNTSGKTVMGTAREMKSTVDSTAEDLEIGATELEVRPSSNTARPVDVMVGTPMKLLEMVKGRGWDRKEVEEVEEKEEREEEDSEESKRKPRRGRDKMLGVGRWKKEPEMGLANVEWVIVDEADVLFDPDFQETTRLLLSDISAARGQPIPFSSDSPLSTPSYPAAPESDASASEPPKTSSSSEPHNYPFNLILTSATIPAALSNYLNIHHPKMQQLVSSNVHHLPKTLQTEYVDWSGGNKLADIEKRIRRVWAADSVSPSQSGTGNVKLSKVLIFCNKSTKVETLGEYLEEKGIKNVALTSTSTERKRGSNKHLAGFLKEKENGAESSSTSGAPSEQDEEERSETSPPSPPTPRVIRPLVRDESRSTSTQSSFNDPKEVPHVMITTSLLSRGLDFSPDIKHVFIVDEPRNILDFLHRAGRSARAGERGKVVVFGKYEGRGSGRVKEVRKKINTLAA